MFEMPFVKVIKNKQYLKRFQVKFRRRRQGKTDYRQRHKLITQDKNKYLSPKYRLVVRFTNRYVICQIVYAEITGDKVLCAANSKELAKHGLEVGLKNYSAAYCTGLLVARRLLQKLNLDEVYKGVEEPTGDVVSCKGENDNKTYYVEELDEEKRPFRALLDVGIRSTTTGSRVFAAMKGASDGGLDIPHNHKRFPGYSKETKQFDADMHKGRIMGEHVADYMREMEEDDEENYNKHFRMYVEKDISADDLEDLYAKVHASIREDPTPAEKVEFKDQSKGVYAKEKKHSQTERKNAAKEKKAALRAAAGLDGGAEDDDEEEDDE